MLRLRILALVVVLGAFPAHCALAAQTPHGTYRKFTVLTENDPQAKIAAWFLPADQARGTIFLSHGFHNRKELLVPYEWIRDRLGWNMILFDFRGHGESAMPRGQQFCTLGYYEQWDLKAMVDWADEHHLAKPYVCMGVSMGASIALRWAGQDERISGVLAYSPFKTGWDAVNQFHFKGHALAPLPALIVHGGFKRMLKDVDIPEALEKRDNLRVWIAAGDHDWFPAADQRAILAASRSPQSLKRLEIIPHSGHAQQWKWPGSDPMITDFLAESRGEARASAGAWKLETVGWIALGGCVFIGLISLRRRVTAGAR